MSNSDEVEEQPVKVEKDVIRKKVTARDIEIWEVAQLSSKIEPKSKPSDIFEKLEQKRKERHEKLINELTQNLNEVNMKTEKNITISSMELKAHAKDFGDKLKTILTNIDIPEVASYCSSVFLGFQKKADRFMSQQRKLVDELHEDLIKCENERAKQNEKLLHVACQKMREIGYYLPYEVQTFAEDEALKMNQLSLNNRRCYEDLKLTLTLVTEQTYKSFMDKVFCIREKWIQRKLQETFYDLQNEAERNISAGIPEAYARLEVKGQQLLLQLVPGNLYNTCKADEWSRNINKAMAAIDDYGKYLLDIYKKAVNAVYKGFNNEVEEIKSKLTSVEVLGIEERIVKPIVFEAQKEQMKEFEDLEAYWQDSLDEIREYVKDVTDFLLDAGKLWDRHDERICESKKLILRALEKAEENNQSVFQDLEVKLNLSLDALRQEHDESKMEKMYEPIVATLNALKAKYESVFLEDVSTIEDFYKMMILEADVLSADIKEFIYEKHPGDNSQMMMRVHSQQIYFPDGNPIFREVRLRVNQIQAVKTWKQGVWVALETLSRNIQESLKPRAESWVRKKINNLAEKKSLQLELLDKRFQRIRIEIYEKRLLEIRAHKQTFDKHKEEVENVLKKLRETFELLVIKEINKINLVEEYLTEMQNKVLFEDRPGVIRGNHITLERKREESENDLKMNFERFRAECDTKISDLRQANIKFLKSIKLFYESGNYSSEEAKTYITLLEAVDIEINTELNSLLKDSNGEELECFKKLTAVFNPVLNLLGVLFEETLFKQITKQRLKNFKADIQDLARSIKLDFEFLSKQCYFLCKSLRRPEASLSTTDEKLWNLVIELLYKNTRNLFYPVSLSETSATNVGEAQEEESTYKGQPDDLFSCQDYKNYLFSEENQQSKDMNFLTLVCSLFRTKMNAMQKAACTFYNKPQGQKVIRDDLIPTTYEMFVEEISREFKYYNTQVYQFWLQIILDFLPLLGEIKSLSNYFIERQLMDYQKAAVKALEDFEKNFLSCIENCDCENTKELEDLEKRLLPLYGYPDNADLLNKLEQEVVRKAANQGIRLESILRKFKSQLKCFRVHHIQQKQEINKIKIIYIKLSNTVFVDDLGNNLLEEILNHCHSKRFCMKSTSSSESEKAPGEASSFVNGGVPEEYKLKLDPSKENFYSVYTYFQQLKRIINREREPKLTTCPQCSKESFESLQGEDCSKVNCEPKLNILLEILDFKKPEAQILESLDDSIRKLKVLTNTQENYHEEKLFKWLSRWKFNVKRVLKLYRVKQEEKEEKKEIVVETTLTPNGKYKLTFV